MKLNISKITDDLIGKWWQHIYSSNFGFVSRISDLSNYEVNKDDILIHKEIKEGERFPTIRYHIVTEKETKEVRNEEVKEILVNKLIQFVREQKKLPFACKLVKVFKNGNVQVNYNPSQFEKIALKVIPKACGINNAETFFGNLEVAENPIKLTTLKEKRDLDNSENQWEIESSKDPNKSYIVTLQKNGIWSCSCPHYTFRRTDCRHIKECKHKL